MPSSGICDAHDLLLDNLNGLKAGQNQLYNLDREKTDKMSDIKLSVARLEESTKAGFSAVREWQEAFEEKQSKRDSELNANMSKLLAMSSRRKWTPKMVIALLTAVIGPSGIAAVIVLLVK
jgi:hypothetical protein